MEAPGQDARASTLRKKVNHLKRVLAEKTLEVDFFRSALQKVEARRQQSGRSGRRHLQANRDDAVGHTC
jgi:hypothetical protein